MCGASANQQRRHIVIATDTLAAFEGLDAALRRWALHIYDSARGALFENLPSLAGVALEVESRRLRFSAIPALFARDLERIPPALNDDLLELYGRSEQALANRFGFFGATVAFDAHIAWEHPQSSAWLTDLHSFDFALDLALTSRISGDERYGRHLRYLLAEWIAGNPPGGTPGWKPIALARRIRNWALAADLAREAFEVQPDFLSLFTTSLAQQATYLAWFASGCADRRARVASSRALLLASRFYCGSRAVELEELSHSVLAQSLAEGFTSFPDHPQPLRQFELASAFLDHLLFGPADGNRESLQQCLETLEGMLHPDGTLPWFGREPLPTPDAIASLFSLGAALLGTPRWKSLSGGELGILPYMLLGEAGERRFDELPQEPWHAESRFSQESGVIRLGDGKSSALLISATPPKHALDHHALFTYELTLCGQRTVVDSGLAPPGAQAGGMNQVEAHNTLLVDGRTPEGDSARRFLGSPVAEQAEVRGYWFSRAWRAGCRLPSKGRFREHPLMHQRGFLLLGGRFWVVLDYLTGSGASRVASLIHFYPVFSLEVRDECVHARSGAASVIIHPVACGANGAPFEASLTTHADSRTAPFPGASFTTQTLSLEWKSFLLPAVFGYILDAERPGPKVAPTLALSGGNVQLVIGTFEFSITIPDE